MRRILSIEKGGGLKIWREEGFLGEEICLDEEGGLDG